MLFPCRSTKEDEPFLLSASNNIDPGEFDVDLPALTEVEQMLISRVHVFIELRRVRGQQYKYTGHIINFIRDTGRVYNKLPLLPRHLDVVILKPVNTSDHPRLNRQFTKDFRVHRQAVHSWLNFLKNNHPGYAYIVIDEQNLGQLPADGNDC